MNEHEKVIQTDFARASGKQVTDVVIDEESEAIYVVADGKIWTCQIGSDDDEFHFVRSDLEEPVVFPFSDEWIALEEAPF